MKFHTHIDPIRQRVNVYCEGGTDAGTGRRVFLTRGRDDSPPEVHAVELGAEPPLWDWFPMEVVDALGEALAPRPEASARHLDDAIGVRDRTLALVERLAAPEVS